MAHHLADAAAGIARRYFRTHTVLAASVDRRTAPKAASHRDLPPYEAYRIGGTNSARGYCEGRVGSGRSYLAGMAELRFPICGLVEGTLFAEWLGTGQRSSAWRCHLSIRAHG
ncbi:hypothetical protein WJX81_006524 [Elliptochloris bilobata]|uniref:Bacterial surface antigen (D15) domain-containing protein n=1 Tax=Elliptochloris bilobata TaxID=381761 RepID=A0AAW1QYS4_9CHLO